MTLTSEQAMERFRADVDDNLPPDGNDAYCLWSNDQIRDYLNQALAEFCERTNYLTKDLEVPVIVDQKTITFNADIIKVRRAALKTANKTLRILNGFHEDTYVEKDYGFAPRNAFDDTTGIPSAIMFDLITGKADLHPIPSTADTLVLNVVLAPDPIVDIGDHYLPVRQDRYFNQAILPYMKFLAYDVQDADAYDPRRSAKFRAQAEEGFLRVRSRVNKATRQPGVTSYGGIV